MVVGSWLGHTALRLQTKASPRQAQRGDRRLTPRPVPRQLLPLRHVQLTAGVEEDVEEHRDTNTACVAEAQGRRRAERKTPHWPTSNSGRVVACATRRAKSTQGQSAPKKNKKSKKNLAISPPDNFKLVPPQPVPSSSQVIPENASGLVKTCA
jgi:hypothetical protein